MINRFPAIRVLALTLAIVLLGCSTNSTVSVWPTPVATPYGTTTEFSTPSPTLSPYPEATPTGYPFPSPGSSTSSPTPVPAVNPSSNPSAWPEIELAKLKTDVLQATGPLAFCDPDYYPIGRVGGEAAHAQEWYLSIPHPSETFHAVAAYAGVSSPEIANDSEKLSMYQAYKQIRVIRFNEQAGGYNFSLLVQDPEKQYRSITVAGFVSFSGQVTIWSRQPGFGPICPICLAEGSRISTPRGQIPVELLKTGDVIWSQDLFGNKIPEIITRLGQTPVPPSHVLVHLMLNDGRQVWVSPGHPTADGRLVGQLKPGDAVDQSRIVSVNRVPYKNTFTYDVLPDGPTGVYWVNGILLKSTLLKGTLKTP